MGVFIALIAGVVLGIGGGWYLKGRFGTAAAAVVADVKKV